MRNLRSLLARATALASLLALGVLSIHAGAVHQSIMAFGSVHSGFFSTTSPWEP